MKQKVKRKSRAGKFKRRTQPYPYEFRKKMVRLYLEEGYSTTVLREHFAYSAPFRPPIPGEAGHPF